MSKWDVAREQEERVQAEQELEQVPTNVIDGPAPMDDQTVFNKDEKEKELLQQQRDAYAARGQDDKVKEIEDRLKSSGQRSSEGKQTTTAANPSVEKR